MSAAVLQSPSWSAMYAARRDAARRFGKTIYQLPLRRRVREVLLEHVRDGDRVLEVGAGNRDFESILRGVRQSILYESMDIDPEGRHDYHDLAEITAQYDCVFALEVAEHIRFDELVSWLVRLAELVRPGGCLVLTTPNTFYPSAYLRDATHCTPLCYDELAGLVELAGLNVQQVVRIYHDPIHRAFLRRYAFGWLFRLLGLDFAKQIMLVARK